MSLCRKLAFPQDIHVESVLWLGGFAGRQLLKALEAGAPVRKKWVTRMSVAEAVAAAKTTRHVRCCVADGKVHLCYQHQVRGPPFCGLNGNSVLCYQQWHLRATSTMCEGPFL